MATRTSSRLCCAFLLALAIAPPAGAAPVVNCNVVGMKDEPLEYAAEGPLGTSVGIPAAPVNGPPCNIPAFAGADGNVDWRFAVRHQAAGFNALQAVDAQLMISGQHVRAPHPAAPHNENAPNFLPEIGSAKINIPAGKTAALSTFAGPKHGTTHRDFYSAAGEFKYDVIGAGGEISGTVRVGAFHQDVKPPSFAAGAAIKDAGVSSVSFDAATGTLSFKPGPVDALNLEGGITGGIDPRYAGDPMLDAVFAISDLTLLGVDADGRFRFGPGSVSVLHPSGLLGIVAAFDELLVANSATKPLLDAVALLSSGASFDLLDAPSAWLRDFVLDHLFHDLPDSTANRFAERAIDFAFLTEVDIVALTGGFTRSALDVPADLLITGNGVVPEPASLALLVAGLGGLAALRRRRRAVALSTALLAGALAIGPKPSVALTITADFSELGPVTDDGTPGGTDVTDLVKKNVAAAIMWWEMIFHRPFNVDVKFIFANTGTDYAFTSDYSEDPANNFTSKATVRSDLTSNRSWYFDPTPHRDEEFDMRDFTDARGVNVGREGAAVPGGPAVGKVDFLAVIKHELGHALGFRSGGTRYIAEAGDGDIDVDPALMSTLESIPVTTGGAHVDGGAAGGLYNHSLMANPGFGSAMRALQSELDILAIASLYDFTSNEIDTHPHPPDEVAEPMSTFALALGALCLARARRRQEPRTGVA